MMGVFVGSAVMMMQNCNLFGFGFAFSFFTLHIDRAETGQGEIGYGRISIGDYAVHKAVWDIGS